ncbi:glycine--tRNA ligase subunit beta [Algimonas porphyrae]|uniref:glycine--tRNA ligase subunit beta n=1 Tax=Algimonas porphyrae TaxID=1128113 RepID=UPI003529E7E9
MAELLFEIFCEEIPARMQVRAGGDLVRLMDSALKEAGLSPGDSTVLTGPRRLTYVTDVETRSPDVSEDRKGPRVGSHEKAIEGFMRGAGISDISEAEIRTDKKGDFYVAVIRSEGRETVDILREAIPAVMGDFPWPKSMKSGDSDFRWVRPLRGLTVLLDGKSVDGITVGGITSDDQVHGHRQMGPGPFTVTSLADYRAQLEGEGRVYLDREQRKALILEQASAVCSEVGLELVDDAGLLDEVAGLVEWPVALLGDMDPDFLELPDEVIRLTLKSHQKTFTVRDPKTGKLAAHFVIIANLETPDQGATIKAGNAKVISARLADARFFQEEDRKKKLQDYYDQLDEVVFHKKLGSVRDKAERVAALAKEIAPHVGANPILAEKAARLAKCDLVTQTVIEATSLQGKVGRWMYEAEGGDPKIAVAIEDHYKPQGPSDAVPNEPIAVAVALADKIDTLVGFWAIGEKPTGSKDPYALRRAALGVIRTLSENRLRLGLQKLLFWHHDFIETEKYYEERLEHLQKIEDVKRLGVDSTEASLRFQGATKAVDSRDGGILSIGGFEDLIETNELLSFLLDRLRVYLRDQGHRHDVIDAVIAQGEDDLLAIAQRVEALGAFLSDKDGEDLVQGYKRAANILRAEQKKGDLDLTDFDTLSGFTADDATGLQRALAETRPAIDVALDAADYPAALSALADLREPIDAFFENVVVNSDDADERARRLALLSAIVETFHGIADFSRLDG